MARHWRTIRQLFRPAGFHPPTENISDPAKLKPVDISFVYAAVSHEHPGMLASTVGALVDEATSCGWMIQDILGNVVVIVSGLDHMKEYSTCELPVLIQRLQSAGDGAIRIIFGSRRALCGNLGGSTRTSYGVQFVDALEIVSALNDVPVGTAVEYSSA